MYQKQINLLLYILIGIIYQGAVTGSSKSCYNQSIHSSFQTKEHELIQSLTTDLNPNVRPVMHPDDSVQVLFSVASVSKVDLDESNHLVKMKGWLYQTWKDPKLAWDKTQYCNLQEIRLPSNKIWTPNILLYNSNKLFSLFDYSHSVVIVRYDGTVFYIPIDIDIQAHCDLDLSYFPYDRQTCELHFGSWTNNVTRVNINLAEDRLPEEIHGGKEWKVTEHNGRRTELNFGEPSGMHAVVSYSFTFTRNPVYYTYVFVLPSVVLSFLIVFLYLIPPESGERLTLGGATLIVVTVLVMMLENHLPTEVATPPLLLKFMLYDLFLVIIALFFTTMSLNFHHRDVRRGAVPSWLRKIFFGKLSYYLCLQGTVYSSLTTNDQSGIDATFDEVTLSGSSPRDLRVDQELQDTTALPSSPTMAIEKTMDEIRRYLRICAAKATLPEAVPSHRQTVVSEWHLLALIVDRVLFCVFMFMNIVMAIAMLRH